MSEVNLFGHINNLSGIGYEVKTMLCYEHAFENAIVAIEEGQSYEEWYEHEKDLNLPYVKSDPEEIWGMAIYTVTTYKHWD